MSYKPYKPFIATTIGTSVSCYTLERMLNEIGDNYLSQRITANIMRYFAVVRRVSLAIHCVDTRKYVGKLMLNEVKADTVKFHCPEKIHFVIRNIKYAYIKDMMISDCPLNYERKLRPHEMEEYYESLGFENKG